MGEASGAAGARLHHVVEFEATGRVTAFFSSGATRAWRNAWAPECAEARKNIENASAELGISLARMTFAVQKHTGDVRVVTAAEAGEGAARPRTVGPHDGLITCVPGILLCTVEADCLPVYLFDPVRSVIGMVHSGWRGTAQLIAPRALELMGREYGTRPEDVLVHFGPAICGACYEVGPELKDEFARAFAPDELARFFAPLPQGKFLLSNADAVRTSLLRVGVAPAHLSESGICTFEHAEYASYRRDGEQRNCMLTALMLND